MASKVQPAKPPKARPEKKEDIAIRLRRTRANMIGTEDEDHYWDCVDAAIEIERLRGLLERTACTETGEK